MAFTSYLHDHPLNQQYQAATSGTKCCSVCRRDLQGEIYVCEVCGSNEGFQAHKSCVHLDQKIQHHLHPCPLILRLGEHECFCDACFEYSDLRVFYSCKECNFSLDVHCSKVPTPEELQSPSGEGKKLLHFSHGHPLTFFTKPHGMFDDHNEACLCRICGAPCSSGVKDVSVVGCNGCKFFLHGPCLGMLPHRIRQSSLHPCDLILYAPLSKPTVSAGSRTQADPNQALMFRCGRCRFNLCMPCWFSPKAVSRCREPERDTNSRLKLCSVCGRIRTAPRLEKDSIDCSLSQLQSFQGLPRQIQHVSHPFQPIPLVDLPVMGIYPMRCSLCLGYCRDSAFLCFQEECPLSLHPECALLTPTVMSSDHKHPLTVVEMMYDDGVQCSWCRGSCSNYSVLRCQVPRCNYTIHLWCGPLPCYIKHPVHAHPLALKDYLVNEDDEDDDEKSFCCHFCEEPRDPRLGVYCCEQGCHMICEVQCVASEVIAMLRGQRGDEVKLRIVGRAYQRTCRILTNIDLLKEVKVDVGEEEGNAYPEVTFRQVLSAAGYSDHRREPDQSYLLTLENSKDMSDFVLSEEAFAELISSLESHEIIDEIAPDKLVRDLAGSGMASGDEDREAIKSIFQYCPVAIHCIVLARIRQEAKIPSIAFVSEVLESLITTKVVDVNEEKLREWWGYLNWIKQAGVNIEFMFDRLKRVARAYLGLRARNLVAEKERELEEITRKIEELRTKAEAVKTQRDIYRMSLSNQTTFVKQCLQDARSLRWKPAVKVLDGRREPK